jgi:hypothetical protein
MTLCQYYCRWEYTEFFALYDLRTVVPLDSCYNYFAVIS